MGLEKNEYQTAAKVLERKQAKDLIKKTSKGVFYKPKQSVFGEIAPNYGDFWYYVPDDGVATLYIWLTDGSSDYFFDLLPPVFN